MAVFAWLGAITLVDEHGLKTLLRFMIPNEVFTPYDSAKADLDAIVAALDPLTDANIAQVSLTQLLDADEGLGAANSDVSDEAAIVTFINATGTQAKYHTVRIPAPVDALFTTGDLTVVDETHAGLIAYIGELADRVEVSDGEQINDLIQNGIAYGFWRSVKKQ